MTACIGQPISWLRLETFALDPRDAAVADHVAACPACARCLGDIRSDVVALPPLAVPERAPRRRWLRFAAPAMAFVAAAVIVLAVWRDHEPEREDLVRVKGVGAVVVDLVRERDGVIRDDVRTFRAGDRWKIVVTCPPAASAWVEVVIVDPDTTDRPIAPGRIACGNRVVLPGAFAITGTAIHRVCIRVAAEADAVLPRVAPRPGGDGVACVTLRPE